MIISYIGSMSFHELAYQLLLTLHFIGLAIGLGGAGITDVTFFKAIRMADRVTAETVAWMRGLSQMVWAGIGILAVSGLGLLLLNPAHYFSSPGFLAKMVIVTLLIINGIFLNFYVTARLTTFNFSDTYKWRGAAWRARKLSFVFGAISGTSWYSALFIAMFKDTFRLPFVVYMLFYVVALAGAIVGSLFLEWKITSRYKRAKEIPTAASPLPVEQYLSGNLSTLPTSPQASPATNAPVNYRPQTSFAPEVATNPPPNDQAAPAAPAPQNKPQ